MQPIFLKEIYKDYLWGGTKLKEKYNKNTDLDIVAESWEICANENGDNIILNGKYKNMLLSELFNNMDLKESIFGTKCRNMKKFPILIKFIDAKKDLSIQVHPNDEYALKNENSYGKNEAWYIVDCPSNASIICGLKDTEKSVKEILDSDDIEKYLNYVNVKKGDTIYIPAGLVHAIKENIIICEIQQNSNVTYRIYDYDRVDKNGEKRQLHTKQAIDVVNQNIKPQIISENGNNKQELITNEYFKIKKIDIEDEYKDCSTNDSFFAVNVVEGNGKLFCNNNVFEITQGNSFIIPANLGEYLLKGKMKILITSI